MVSRHYEKIIVGCCFLTVFANMGLASTAFSVHQPYIVAIPGVGDTGGSLILSMRTFVSLLAMLVVDRYYRSLDVRRGMFVASVCTAVGFAVYSRASDLPTFMVGAVFLGVGYGFGGMVSVTYLVNRWFASGIGSVVGVASMGSGLASIVVPLVIVRIIEASSLSIAFTVESGTALALGVLVLALVRNRPSDVGLKPYERTAGKVRTSRVSLQREAPRAERFVLFGAMVAVGVFCCCGMTYMSVLATSSGFDAVFAATLVSISGATLTVAKFVCGELFDRLGTMRASVIMFAFALVGYVLCCFAGMGNNVVMVIAALFIGAGLSLGTVGISVWSLDLSLPETRSREVKNFQVAYALGGFIANTLPGIVKDLVGTYVVSYAAMIVVVALACLVVLRFYRRFTVSG